MATAGKMEDGKLLTTSSGMPVPSNDDSLTVGERGPVLLEDFYLLEKNAHFNRERIPERVVHAKGAGSYGVLKITKDMTKYTKAKLFSHVGKETECFVRFSQVAGELGSADTVRDPRGFALRMFTEEGNYDLVMNNTPIFFVRDGLRFPDFIRTQKRNPKTNLKDPNAKWDFWSLSPESLHQVTILFSDRGTPNGYRHMHGYSSHTFSWINDGGERFWVKYHFKTKQGIKNFTHEEATEMAGLDPDYATRDLYDAIDQGNYPAWTVCVQIMPFEDAEAYDIHPFDLTKVWPHKDYPEIEFGELILNRNPSNFFAEVEQAAFNPANIVPGIGFSPDKMLQARLFAYSDTQRYRLGVNYNLLPINRPRCPVRNYQRDGLMRFDDNGGDDPNYAPNTLNGPDYSTHTRAEMAYNFELQGMADRFTKNYQGNNDYQQAGNLFRLMKPELQEQLFRNIAGNMKTVRKEVQQRQIAHFYLADPAYGEGVAKALGVDPPSSHKEADRQSKVDIGKHAR